MVRLPLTIEHALLGFLRQRPQHGYEIYQQLSDPDQLGLVWQLKQSQLYALLAKLEERGYISATIEPQEARPPRKVFHLTPTGQEVFWDWVQSPVLHGRQLRLDFLAKLHFARREGPEVAAQLVERQRTTCRNWLETQQKQADSLRDRQPYQWLVYQFRLGQIKAMLVWLDACEQALAVDISSA